VARFKVGVQLHPQHCAMDDLRAAAREVEAIGADSLWTWDHFFPLYGEPNGPHFEGWTTLTAFACDTRRVQLGHLVTCNSYRNPELLADMARTVDHIANGRVILGIGSGWFERDYTEYGYEFGTARSRLGDLEDALPRIRARLGKLNPRPAHRMPILIGGDGERVTLRLVAQHADMWNGFGPADAYARRNRILNDWCAEVGRDPSVIERTVLIDEPEDVERASDFLAAGATHLIYEIGAPFELEPVRRLIAKRDAS
jgi:probable F420-dependent oxidoreductase